MTINTKSTYEARQRAGDAPQFVTPHATGGGSLALLCNTLRIDEALEIVVVRQRGAWHVAVTFPDGTTRTGDANTVHNALWEVLTS